MNEVKRAFNPEFINRIDEIVVFHNLDRAQLGQIFDIMVKEIDERLTEQKIKLAMKPRARQWLIDKGFDEKYGARPLRRLLQKQIEDPLSVEILKGRFTEGDTVDVELRNDRISFRRRGEKPELPEPGDEPLRIAGERTGLVNVTVEAGSDGGEPGTPPA